MNTKNTRVVLVTAVMFLFAGIYSSCLKQKADIPADASNYDPGATDPSLKVTHTLMQLKAVQSATGGGAVQVTEDMVVSGIVTANDIAGNFYKQIMIQDSTTGIAVLIEKNGLLNDFPVGRKVYLRCKGLWVGDYGRFKQVGFALDETKAIVGIPTLKIGSTIVKANYPNKIPVKSVTIADLVAGVNNEALLGTLITLDSNIQFASNAIGLTYAQAPGLSSGTDRSIEDCANKTIVMRNSGYAKFQGEKIPTGRGKLTAIFSRYNNTGQLLIRDLNDVQFNDTVRCDGVVFAPATPISIAAVRDLYPDTAATNIVPLPNKEIHGTVISSVADSNINSTSFYMQDESGEGILVFTGSAHGLALGDSVTVGLNGNQLIVYRGSLELKKGTTSNLIVTKVGSGKSVTPKVVSIAQLNNDLLNPLYSDRQYEGSLVKVQGVTLTNSGNVFAGNTTVNDGTSNILMFVYFRAPYKTATLPTGLVSVTGIANNYANPTPTPQILIRKTSDVN